MPVLAIVGEFDSYYYNKPTSGHCGLSFFNRPNSESIVIPEGFHDVLGKPGIKEKIIEFLRSNTD
jgi:hypothetical protein